MGGGSGEGRISKPIDQYNDKAFSESDLKAFAESGVDIAPLRGKLVANQAIVNSNGVETTGEEFINASGQNVTDLARKFLAFKSKNDLALTEHEAYLSKMKAQPGRSATLLSGAPGAQTSGKLFSGIAG